MESELDAEIDSLTDLKQKIRETISQMKNVSHRLIPEKRYLSFMKWEDIACDMGYTRGYTL